MGRGHRVLSLRALPEDPAGGGPPAAASPRRVRRRSRGRLPAAAGAEALPGLTRRLNRGAAEGETGGRRDGAVSGPELRASGRASRLNRRRAVKEREGRRCGAADLLGSRSGRTGGREKDTKVGKRPLIAGGGSPARSREEPGHEKGRGDSRRCGPETPPRLTPGKRTIKCNYSCSNLNLII